jgi:NAD(P)-dependent dehydrogenase (short-subunit alcohol dehydrogenase family)
MQKLTGKSAVITGGTSGIGAATARLFAEHGARVLIAGRDEGRLLRAQQEIPGDVRGLRCDVTEMDDLARLADTARAELGGVDVLFVNAGSGRMVPFELVTSERFDADVGANFKGAFFTIQKLLPSLSRGASIIVTTSITNQVGTPECSVYAGCKAALRSLVRSLSPTLTPRGIRINAISPGMIDTPALDGLGIPAEATAAIKAQVSLNVPIGRLGEATEVAQVALFLASDDSSYIVGQEIVVDGGLTTMRPRGR